MFVCFPIPYRLLSGIKLYTVTHRFANSITVLQWVAQTWIRYTMPERTLITRRRITRSVLFLTKNSWGANWAALESALSMLFIAFVLLSGFQRWRFFKTKERVNSQACSVPTGKSSPPPWIWLHSAPVAVLLGMQNAAPAILYDSTFFEPHWSLSVFPVPGMIRHWPSAPPSSSASASCIAHTQPANQLLSYPIFIFHVLAQPLPVPFVAW